MSIDYNDIYDKVRDISEKINKLDIDDLSRYNVEEGSYYPTNNIPDIKNDIQDLRDLADDEMDKFADFLYEDLNAQIVTLAHKSIGSQSGESGPGALAILEKYMKTISKATDGGVENPDALIAKIAESLTREKARDILDRYINPPKDEHGNTIEPNEIDVKAALKYYAENGDKKATKYGSIGDHDYDRYDDYINDWTNYWNEVRDEEIDALNKSGKTYKRIPIDPDVVKAIFAWESNGGTNPRNRGITDPMQVLSLFDPAYSSLSGQPEYEKDDQTGEYEPKAPIKQDPVYGIPSEGYGQLNLPKYNGAIEQLSGQEAFDRRKADPLLSISF